MTLAEEFLDLYKKHHTVEVTFIKANGEERKMICQRQDDLEKLVTGKQNVQNRETVKRVTELLESKDETSEGGEYQWRSVPLDRIIDVKDLAPF